MIREFREPEGGTRPIEARLADLSDKGAEILSHWAETDRRYTQAVSELEARLRDWGSIEHRLRTDSLERIRAFEQTIAEEWKALRQMHEEPLKQLREQASALGETSVAAANLALRGYERSEARLAALETDLRGQLSQLSRDVHAALAEMRRDMGRPAMSAPAEPFQLDSVMRIHEELRTAPAPPPLVESRSVEPEVRAPVPVEPPTSAATVGADVGIARPRPVEVSSPQPWPAVVVDAPVAPDEPPARMPDVADAPELARLVSVPARVAAPNKPNKTWRVVPAVVIVAILALGAWSYIRMNRASEAREAARVSAAAAARVAEEDAAEAAAAAVPQEEALASEVTSAPDVLQFNLTGVGDGRGASGQLVWSRSRGLVFSAARVPAIADGSTYAVWLLTGGDPVRVAAFTPDPDGRAKVVASNPPSLPPIHSASVTLEPATAGARPVGPIVLRRAVR